MSFKALFKSIMPRLLGNRWGARIVDGESGEARDTGVHQFAEEFAAAISSDDPIPVDEPIRILRNFDGELFKIIDGVEQTPAETAPTGTGTAGQVIQNNTEVVRSVGQLYVVVDRVFGSNDIMIAPADSNGNPAGPPFQVKAIPTLTSMAPVSVSAFNDPLLFGDSDGGI